MPPRRTRGYEKRLGDHGKLIVRWEIEHRVVHFRADYEKMIERWRR